MYIIRLATLTAYILLAHITYNMDIRKQIYTSGSQLFNYV